MTQDEIIEMARQVGFVDWENSAYRNELQAFAKLVAAKAIAELESQEPVGRFAKFTDGVWRPVTDYSAGVPLYTHPPQRTEQEPVAYDKTEMNCFVQDLYDKKMKEGRHGHYETMFHVVHQAIKRVPPQSTWVGLTPEEILDMFDDQQVYGSKWLEFARAVEAKLKQKNGFAEEKNA